MTDNAPDERIPTFDVAVLFQVLGLMGHALNLPDEFLKNLLFEDDDWSFVIKAHALLEAAVCAWIAASVRRPELENALTEIDMRTRIKLLSALNLGTATQRQKMAAFGNLRNRLAHRASESHFTFVSYLSEKGRRGEFFKNSGLESLEGKQPLSLLVRVALWGFVGTVVIETLNERDRGAAEQLRLQFLEKANEISKTFLE